MDFLGDSLNYFDDFFKELEVWEEILSFLFDFNVDGIFLSEE